MLFLCEGPSFLCNNMCRVVSYFWEVSYYTQVLMQSIIVSVNATLDAFTFTSPENQTFLRKEVNHYITFLAGPPIVFFILVLLYFPSSPPSPPSETSQLERTALLQGTKDLLKNRSAWLIMMVFAVSQSIPGTWSAMMVTNLSKIEVDGQCLR